MKIKKLHPLQTSKLEQEKWLCLARHYVEIVPGETHTLYRLRVTAGFYKMAFMNEWTLANGVRPNAELEAKRLILIWQSVHKEAPAFFEEARVMGWVPDAALPSLIILH